VESARFIASRAGCAGGGLRANCADSERFVIGECISAWAASAARFSEGGFPVPEESGCGGCMMAPISGQVGVERARRRVRHLVLFTSRDEC
jgi:hypothetical protein